MAESNSENISILFDADKTEVEWNTICHIILRALQEKGFQPLEVVIY